MNAQDITELLKQARGLGLATLATWALYLLKGSIVALVVVWAGVNLAREAMTLYRGESAADRVERKDVRQENRELERLRMEQRKTEDLRKVKEAEAEAERAREAANLAAIEATQRAMEAEAARKAKAREDADKAAREKVEREREEAAAEAKRKADAAEWERGRPERERKAKEDAAHARLEQARAAQARLACLDTMAARQRCIEGTRYTPYGNTCNYYDYGGRERISPDNPICRAALARCSQQHNCNAPVVTVADPPLCDRLPPETDGTVRCRCAGRVGTLIQFYAVRAAWARENGGVAFPHGACG